MFFYSLGLVVALAVSAPWWLWKITTTGKYREGLDERLGRFPARLSAGGDARPAIWIHAVSVGELIAVSGLVRQLGARAAGYRIVISTTTRAGQRIARERFGPGNVFYYPLDFAFAVRPYLRALRPRLFVLAETEFWPRMLAECRSAGIPVAVVNARISDRSYPRYLRLRFLWRQILRAVTAALAQSEVDISRLRAIGIGADRVKLGGNLKYDVRAVAQSELVDALREALPAEAKVLVAGSTLEGEERLLVGAWPALTVVQPELRMVLAPRHPERFAEVAALLERSGVKWFLRSECKPGLTASTQGEPICGAEAPRFQRSGEGQSDAAEVQISAFPAGAILLLNSLGELASVYSLALLALVGGSWVAAGGHNPLEPAQFGVPVLMGPRYENFRDIVEKLRATDAIRIVDPGDLREVLTNFLQDDSSLRAMGERGREVFLAEAGATARAVEALLALLPGDAA